MKVADRPASIASKEINIAYYMNVRISDYIITVPPSYRIVRQSRLAKGLYGMVPAACSLQCECSVRF